MIIIKITQLQIVVRINHVNARTARTSVLCAPPARARLLSGSKDIGEWRIVVSMAQMVCRELADGGLQVAETRCRMKLGLGLGWKEMEEEGRLAGDLELRW